jgi:hypothetical protein
MNFVNKRMRRLVSFAESYMLASVRQPLTGELAIVIDWELGKRLNGVWLITDKGFEVYRQIPDRSVDRG